ncbi:PTS transporter subunit EIIC [Faecalibacterium prausnitzii]|uniref:PTS transporter subunit EIIC n=1 Tax=Faecalibacterium TaxID=216851 RepID=UPI0032AF9D60
MKHRITAALERFSRAMLAPLTYLSAAGLLLAAGALLTSTALSGALPLLQWGPVRLMGRILYKCLSAVISNLSVLFCTGLAASLAKQEKHQAAFIALMSYFIYLTAGNVTLAELGLLAQPDGLTGLYGAGQTSVLGIQTVDTGVFGGVLLGLLTAHVYDRTCKKAHKGILGGVFSGERWSFTCMAALAAVLGFGACFVWPPVQKAIAALTGFLAASGNIGLFLYGFLERLLIPTGLHHLVYMPFQFSQLGGQLTVGSVTYTGAYVVMMTEYNLGLPFSDGIVWMYTGFTKTFGYFGIAAAFIFCARRGSRRKTAAQLLPLAFTASLASVTEPMDFLFCFSAPVLWLAHAAISGGFIVLLHLCHVTAFTSNLLGSLAMNLSAGAARTHYPVLYLLGLAQIAVYFVVFTALIKALDLPTPGRRPEEPVRPEAAPLDDAGVEKLIAALGGRENICTVDNCFTRLRVTVQDAAFVREQALRELPCSGVVQNGCNVQIVFGIRAPQVRQAVEQRLDRVVC